MNYLNIIPASSVDFNEGWSTVLQVSHCVHMCDGCFNKSSWHKNSGNLFTEDTYQELLSYASKPFINNIVMQGGDPLSPLNYKEMIPLCKRLKEELPSKKIVVFTGYTYQEVLSSEKLKDITKYVSYIVDGKYEKNNPTNNPFIGSANQHIIKVKQS